MTRVLSSARVAVLLLVQAACATGGSSDAITGDDDSQDPQPDAASVARSDAGPPLDASPEVPDAAPPDAAPPDASPEDPDAAPCVPTTLQVLSNPTFDLGVGGGWAESSSKGYEVIVASSDPGLGGVIAADTAPNLVWLGGDVELDDDLGQELVVPDSATALVVRGRRWLTTSETATVSFDTLRVSLRDGAGGLLQEIVGWSNLDATTGWVDFAVTLAAPHAGDVVRLQFTAHNDFSDHSNFFLDSLALDATACP